MTRLSKWVIGLMAALILVAVPASTVQAADSNVQLVKKHGKHKGAKKHHKKNKNKNKKHHQHHGGSTSQPS